MIIDESAAVTAFLTLLSQSDKQEIEDKLRQRVEFSERAIGKLLQAHDRLLQRRQKLWDAVRSKRSHGEDRIIFLFLYSCGHLQIYTVSQKRISDIFSCNLSKHYLIFIIFGKNVTERLCNQKLVYFPILPE